MLAEAADDLHLLTMDGRLRRLRRRDVTTLEALGRVEMPVLAPRSAVSPPSPDDWATYNGDPGGNRHSPHRQIAPDNVARLQSAWTFAVPGVRALRATPLVVDGVMYVGAPNEVVALDARTGRSLWHYRRPRTPGVIGDAGAAVNRGVALAGDRLFMVTDDARLVALHRATGQVLWEVVMADFRAHYGATSAPLVVGDLDFTYLLQRHEDASEALPNAFAVVLEGTAHIPNLERPDLFDPLLLEFLAAVTG